MCLSRGQSLPCHSGVPLETLNGVPDTLRHIPSAVKLRAAEWDRLRAFAAQHARDARAWRVVAQGLVRRQERQLAMAREAGMQRGPDCPAARLPAAVLLQQLAGFVGGSLA